MELLLSKLAKKLGKRKTKKKISLDKLMSCATTTILSKAKVRVAINPKGKAKASKSTNPNYTILGNHKTSRFSNISESTEDSLVANSNQRRNEAILKEADGCWELGKELGLYVTTTDSDGVKIMKDMECRDWEDFERRENE